MRGDPPNVYWLQVEHRVPARRYGLAGGTFVAYTKEYRVVFQPILL